MEALHDLSQKAEPLGDFEHSAATRGVGDYRRSLYE